MVVQALVTLLIAVTSLASALTLFILKGMAERLKRLEDYFMAKGFTLEKGFSGGK